MRFVCLCVVCISSDDLPLEVAYVLMRSSPGNEAMIFEGSSLASVEPQFVLE